MKQTLTDCIRTRPAISTKIQRSTLLCAAGLAMILPASARAVAYESPAPILVDETAAQSSDLLLKMVIEAMLYLLNEIENIQDPQGILLSGESLEEVAGALALGYINLGIDDDLSIAEILNGLDDGELAMDILQDETQTLPLPESLRDILNAVVEDMTDDLATQI